MQKSGLNGKVADELGIHYYKSEAEPYFFAVSGCGRLNRFTAKRRLLARRGQREGWLTYHLMAQDGFVMRGILKHP